jgi:hypothetical protein
LRTKGNVAYANVIASFCFLDFSRPLGNLPGTEYVVADRKRRPSGEVANGIRKRLNERRSGGWNGSLGSKKEN